MIWTVRNDNSVQAFWRDSEQSEILNTLESVLYHPNLFFAVEHELHAVMKAEASFLKSLVSPPRIVLVKDPDAFIPRNPGYIRSVSTRMSAAP